MKTQKRGRGRPKKGEGIQWGLAALMWRNKTDKEIATSLDTTVSTVWRERQKRIKAGQKVECVRRPYSRAKGATLVELLVVVCFVTVIAAIIAGGVLLVKGCNHVVDNGLKDTATEVWEGPKKTEQDSQ